VRLSEELQQARTRGAEERERTARGQSERDSLEQRLQRVPVLEAQLEEGRMEVTRWRQRLADVEARLAETADPQTEKTLRQDLAVKVQLLAAREERVRALEEQNASLRDEFAAAADLRAERDRLHAENAELRAHGFAASPAVNARRAPSASGRQSRGGVLQALVERVSALGDIRSAVVADDLGLVVASHGELGDEVAAVGALLCRAGLQAQRVLPLRTVERITVEDDLRLVLMVRPLGMDDLALVTLGVGASPDPLQVNKLIEEGPRSVL
jgi:predicted regulator of Ras-like GTPase activity (Roadblock/LC7/MglB family)